MNLDNFIVLVDHLENLPRERFNMAEWCGTSCCIAGHASFLANGHYPEDTMIFEPINDPTGVAARWLGMEEIDLIDLFTPSPTMRRSSVWGDNYLPYKSTPQQAAQAVRNFALAEIAKISDQSDGIREFAKRLGCEPMKAIG